jgi:hypothetical protein
MSIISETITMKVSAGGAGTYYSTLPLDGTVAAIRVTIGTLTGGAVDFVFSDDVTGLIYLTVTDMAGSTDYFPRGAAVNPANTAITNSFVPMPINGRLKIVVAGGGNATTGTATVWVNTGRDASL